MSKKRIDLTGQRFVRLIVLAPAGSNHRGHACWVCHCDCGKESIVVGCNLRNGDIKSCGCLKQEHMARLGKANQGITLSEKHRQAIGRGVNKVRDRIFTAARAAKISKALMGHKLSEQTKRKIGDKSKGRIPSPETRAKISAKLKGALHPNWKGGISDELKTLRNSQEFVEWRKAIFERDDYTCQKCRKRGGDLEAHHILPFRAYPVQRFNIGNGQTLCLWCHRRTFKESQSEVREVLKVA